MTPKRKSKRTHRGPPGRPAPGRQVGSTRRLALLTLRWTRVGALVGAVALALSAAAVLRGESDGRSGDLELVDVLLSEDGSVPGVETNEISQVSREITVPATVLDVTLVNRGTVSAIVTRADARILRAAAFPSCQPTGGPRWATADYDLVLPSSADDVPPRPQTVSITLRQEVPAGQGDRFTLTIGSGIPYTTTATTYQVAVDLHATGRRPVLTLGPFLVAVDLEHPEEHFADDPEALKGCVKANTALLADVLGLPGHRSPRVEEVAQMTASRSR